MTGFIILLSGIITSILRIIVYFLLTSRLLSVRTPAKKSIAAGICGGLIIAVFFYILHFPDFYRMALEALWITFAASRLQKAETRMCLFIAVFYEIAVSFWQFLLSAGIGILFRTAAFLDYETLNGQACSWLLHILLLISALSVSHRQNSSPKSAFRFASALAVTGVIAVITLSEQKILVLSGDTLSMWTILSVVLMMSVQVFNMNRQYEMEKEVARLKSEQTQLLERDYTALNRSYAMNAKLFHDFHNHIGALRQLLSHEKYKEAVQYLDELQEPLREMTSAVRTGDETLDYLVNSKAAEAAADAVPLQIQVEFPRNTNIKSTDLCAVLGNLLDNAIEAARQVPSPQERFVRLTMRRINQMLVIKVENSFFTPPEQEDGFLKTSKTANGLHGWGLKSAQTAVEKYDGTVKTTYTDNTFRAVATLSYRSVAIEPDFVQK